MDYRQLLPEPKPSVHVDSLLDGLKLETRAHADRPYTVVNFIASVDGRATYQERSGGLGDEGDRAMFHGLRERVDAVLAGTGTLTTERYGRILGKPERRQRREARGETPEPLAVIVSRTGNLPLDIPLLAEPEQRVVVFTATGIDTGAVRAELTVVTLDPAELTLTKVMRTLRHDHGIRSLLCEGGPLLFGALLDEGLVDELFLTLAPKLTGGGRGPAIAEGGELPQLQPLQIAWLLEREQALYLRYALVHQTFPGP